MEGRFFDTRRFPLVVARVPSGEDAARDIGAFYAEWDEVLARGRHAVILDMTRVDVHYIGAVERRATASEAERRRDALKAGLLAEARVCPSTLVRATMTAFDWLVGRWFAHPIAHFATMEQAERWIAEQLAASPRARPPG